MYPDVFFTVKNELDT